MNKENEAKINALKNDHEEKMKNSLESHNRLINQMKQEKEDEKRKSMKEVEDLRKKYKEKLIRLENKIKA